MSEWDDIRAAIGAHHFMVDGLQAVEPGELFRPAGEMSLDSGFDPSEVELTGSPRPGVWVSISGVLDSMGHPTAEVRASTRELLVDFVRDNWGDDDKDWFRSYIAGRIVEIGGPIARRRPDTNLNDAPTDGTTAPADAEIVREALEIANDANGCWYDLPIQALDRLLVERDQLQAERDALIARLAEVRAEHDDDESGHLAHDGQTCPVHEAGVRPLPRPRRSAWLVAKNGQAAGIYDNLRQAEDQSGRILRDGRRGQPMGGRARARVHLAADEDAPDGGV